MESKENYSKSKLKINKSQLKGWNQMDHDNIFHSKSLLSLLQNQIKVSEIKSKLEKQQNNKKKYRIRTGVYQCKQQNKKAQHIKTFSQGNQLEKQSTFRYQSESKQLLKQTLYSHQYSQKFLDKSQFKPFHRVSDSTFPKLYGIQSIQEINYDFIKFPKNSLSKIEKSNLSCDQNNIKKVSMKKFSKTKSLTPITQFIAKENNEKIKESQLTCQTLQAKKSIKAFKNSQRNIKNKLSLSKTILQKLKTQTVQKSSTIVFGASKIYKQGNYTKINSRNLLNKLIISKQKLNSQKSLKKIEVKLKKNRIQTQPILFSQFNDAIIYDHSFDINDKFKICKNNNVFSLSQQTIK